MGYKGLSEYVVSVSRLFSEITFYFHLKRFESQIILKVFGNKETKGPTQPKLPEGREA
jgi:hypothetical protein